MNELLNSLTIQGRESLFPKTVSIAVGMGTCGIGNGADQLYDAFAKAIEEKKLAISLRKVGCMGYCAAEPLVNVYIPGKPLLVLHRVMKRDVSVILRSLEKQSIPKRLILCKISCWDHHSSISTFGEGYPDVIEWNEVAFFRRQKKMILRNAGLIDPESIAESLAVGGYSAFFKAVTTMKSEQVIDEVKTAKLRGRGGAGFSTGIKWELLRKASGDKKYIICNADEGDPGAYMNRNEIESDPHSLIEGMLIGAYAMGASEGIIYIRAEYPLAVERLTKAIDQARSAGLLGKEIPGTSFRFDLSIVKGAGAFVCGEETSLMASIEGFSGRARPRPPFPAQKGYLGYPTNINNVETWCNVPIIIGKGSAWFIKTGTDKSPGTKVFSLVGKVKNTGLVELPLGEPLSTLVYEIGGGAPGREKRIKAVQSGGPSGGCIPADKFDTPVDYESLAEIGAIMGSGGMVVLDQDNCMVDTARYFIEFTRNESCGKCVPCREGLAQELELLNRIVQGTGTEEDLELMERLGQSISDSALCGFGQTAPNPVLTTLKYFRKEYEEHIHRKHCSGGICEALFDALCVNSCPMHMNIPAYLEMLKENRLEEAFESTIRDNPLPGTIGRICHFHCQMRCRRETVDEPVHQGEIHRYLADTMYKMGREQQIYDILIKEKLPATGKKIAIVGAGPAGLTAAFYLVRLGHDVVVYDANPKAGGVLRYGIPAYRLPREILDKELQLFKKLQVKFIFNKRLGTDIHLEQLKAQYDAVLLAIGAYEHIDLSIPGAELKQVVQGTEFLDNLEKKRPVKVGKHVVIIGGGNVAIDAARSLWRLGASVTVVYRRSKDAMPANKLEIEEAEAEGIKFIFFAAPLSIKADRKQSVRALEIMEMEGGTFDTSGRRRPVETGKTRDIECDMIVIAAGEKVDSGLLERQKVATTKRGTACVDSYTYHTGTDKVYGAGDMVSGPSTAAEAMGLAREAAASIDVDLMGIKRFDKVFKEFSFSHEPPKEIVMTKQTTTRHLDVDSRKGNFEEINKGYMGDQARIEATRCLRCDIRLAGRG